MLAEGTVWGGTAIEDNTNTAAFPPATHTQTGTD